MKDWKYPADLEPGDVIVLNYDEGEQAYYFGWQHTQPTTRRRVPATIVETLELDGTGTEGTATERNGTAIYVLGQPNRWMIRFFVADGGTNEGRSRYTHEVPGLLSFEVLPKHHPVCIECVEPWPCREHRQGVEAQRFAHELDNMCQHCGRPIGSAFSVTFHDGVTFRRYHQAKKYRANGRRCVDVAAEDRATMRKVLDA